VAGGALSGAKKGESEDTGEFMTSRFARSLGRKENPSKSKMPPHQKIDRFGSGTWRGDRTKADPKKELGKLWKKGRPHFEGLEELKGQGGIAEEEEPENCVRLQED